MLTGQYTSTPYALLQNNATITNDEEEADAFAKYLQEVFTTQLSQTRLKVTTKSTK